MIVVGVGNPFRGDDAAGLEAARRVRQLCPELSVVEWSADLLRLFDTLPQEDSVILVDALSSGAAPGTIRRWEAGRESLPESGPRTSTHGFGIAAAIELARLLGRLPPRVVLYGIEGKCFDEGAPLSGPVAAGLGELASRIVAEASQHA